MYWDFMAEDMIPMDLKDDLLSFKSILNEAEVS